MNKSHGNRHGNSAQTTPRLDTSSLVVSGQGADDSSATTLLGLVEPGVEEGGGWDVTDAM